MQGVLTRVRHRSAGLALGLGPLLWLATAASAQLPEEEARRSLDAAQRAAEARAEAERLRPLEAGRVVTWEEVLARPDDVELNYLYAQSQVRAGNLRGAAAALERILLLEPDLPRVRLFYAVVLHRLGESREARRELERVRAYDLTPRVAAQVDAWLAEVDRAEQRTRYSAGIGVGGQLDSNRNAAAHSNEVLRVLPPQTRIELPTDLREQDDVALLGLASLGFDHDLGFQEGHRLRGNLRVQAVDQLDLDDLSLRAADGELAGLWRAGQLELEPVLFGSLLELSSRTFFSDVGLGLRGTHRLDASRDLFAGTRVSWEDYDRIPDDAVSAERTGLRTALDLGGRWRVTPRQRLEGALLFVDKEARGSHQLDNEDVFSYRGVGLVLGHTWLLGDGQYLLGRLGLERDRYEQADLRVDPDKERRDLAFDAGLQWGLPLDVLFGALLSAEHLYDIQLSVDLAYRRVSSNLTNYTYDNLHGALLFSKAWSF